MTMARKPARKPFAKLTALQRDKAVAKYDAGVSFDETRPLTASESARWSRARNGGPKPGGDDKDVAIVIRIDPRLLAKAHAAAQRDGKSLSALISDLLSQKRRRAV
jgi:hypothetical protein